MKGLRIGAAVTLAVVVVGLLIGALLPATFGIGTPQAQAENLLGDFAATPEEAAKARPLGEIGPGACWPGDERPSGGTAAGFAHANGPQEAATWLKQNPAAALRLDGHYNAHRDYYLVTEVIPGWDTMDPVERTATYVSKQEAVQLPAPMRVLNHYCKDDEVLGWETQVLPTGEWVNFVPGHGPGTKDPRPANKSVCGNPLLPVLATKPETVVTPPPPGIGGDCLTCTTTTNPPPPGCREGCVPTTEPPCVDCGGQPPCVDCPAPKVASEGAAARGNVPTQVQGRAPAATLEPRPADPPPVYEAPAEPPPPPPAPREEEPPPPPPAPEPEEPFDPCAVDPSHPACG